MRVLLQRVINASVNVKNEKIASIKSGFLIFVGIGHVDTEEDCSWMAQKISNLRIFADDQGKMNLNIQQINGSILSVSQFTLFGDVRKGNRPGFDQAAKPEKAKDLWMKFNRSIRNFNVQVEEGQFSADMKVTLTNDGPVTFWLDSKQR